MPGVTQASGTPCIVTAADQLYARTLAQMLLSAERHRAHRQYRWVAYDLGFEPATGAWLRQRFAWCDWRRFPFEDLPPHYRPGTRSFAWKPWAIWQVLDTAGAPVLWLDSGTVIKGDLSEIFDWTRENGIYAARGRAPLSERCEPHVLDALEVPPRARAMRETVANLVALDPAHPTARALAADWERLSRKPDLLLPETRTIDRHMNDQAVLNALLLPKVAQGELSLPDADMDICAGRPIRMLSTRNKLPPWLPMWADPFARLWYWTYKTVDQALWRRKDRLAQ